MAEKIGSAYVRVFFRSSGEDLADDIKGDKGFEKAGKQAAKQTGEGFNSEWTDQLRERMKNDDNYNKKTTAAYKGKMTKLRNDLNKFWEEERKNIDQGINRPFDDLDRDLVKMNNRFKQITANLPDFMELSGQTEDLDHRWRELDRTMQSVAGWASGIGESFKDSSHTVEVETDKITKNTDGFFSRLGSGWSKAREEQRKTDAENGNVFSRWEKRSGKFSGLMSKLFGKGARNNFMNLVGVIVGGLTSIPTVALKALGPVGDMFGKNLTKPMEESAGVAEQLGGQLAGLVEILPEIGIVAGIALIGLPLLLSAVASLFMLITGAVLALAAALSFALIGAIGAVAGALVPLAAGIGVAVLAISNMDKKSKDAFKGIGKSFKDLGKDASQELFKNAAADAKTFEGVMKTLHPLVIAIAGALREVGESLLKGLSGKQGKAFIAFLTATLPGMIKQIGTIVGNVGQGMAGLFVAVTPLVEEFLGWLTGVTAAFADLGKGGSKSKLSKFFADLQPTMDAVGAAIGQVIGLIFDLFNGPGQKTGGEMFKSLADNVRKFRDFLAGAKKDGSLQEFFDQAKQFTDKIGEAIVAVGQLIAALDTPEMRRVLIFMVDSFVKVVRFITVFARLLADQIHLWFVIGRAIKEAFSKVGDAVHHAWRVIKDTFKPVKPFIQNLIKNISWDGLVKAAKHAWGAIKSTFAPVGPWFAARWHTISSAASNAWHAVTTAASTAWHAVERGFGNALDAVARFFHSLPGRISDLAGDFGRIAGNWGSAIVDALRHVPGDVVDLFRGLGAQIASAIGSIIPHINWPSPPKWLSKITATGGVFAGAQMRVIGEAGAEAVVPLHRPLAQVDPAVRWLSAIAQGKADPTGQSTGPRRVVDIGGITINTPTGDPVAVATQVVNRVAAASYI